MWIEVAGVMYLQERQDQDLIGIDRLSQYIQMTVHRTAGESQRRLVYQKLSQKTQILIRKKYKSKRMLRWKRKCLKSINCHQYQSTNYN
ncbi:hypothetical protein DPMN_128411 [Dreissena polymorpha]|uniref:Uncharacterized protein n=1 Tax=Dreissena polymorpha TaxID=45954 RepID=A0A9D4JVQ4_DREPO|nr:hypothetical protein DPMN_128411 [Dreissena polymorpha]